MQLLFILQITPTKNFINEKGKKMNNQKEIKALFEERTTSYINPDFLHKNKKIEIWVIFLLICCFCLLICCGWGIWHLAQRISIVEQQINIKSPTD
jgi:hypothetical protein